MRVYHPKYGMLAPGTITAVSPSNKNDKEITEVKVNFDQKQ